MSLQAEERATYESIWGAVESYQKESPGEQYLPAFLQMVGDRRGSVLDAGCGTGKGSLALRDAGFSVTMCDLTDAGLVPEARAIKFKPACLWHPIPTGLFRYDYVYCCDVLEHLPTAFTMLAVSRMLEVSREGAFLGISLMPDSFGVWVGKPLHQTVQPYEWWRASLSEIGTIVESRDLLTTGLYFVKPRA